MNRKSIAIKRDNLQTGSSDARAYIKYSWYPFVLWSCIWKIESIDKEISLLDMIVSNSQELLSCKKLYSQLGIIIVKMVMISVWLAMFCGSILGCEIRFTNALSFVYMHLHFLGTWSLYLCLNLHSLSSLLYCYTIWIKYLWINLSECLIVF